VLDEPGLVEMLTHRARLPEFAHVHPVGALTVQLEGKALTEMAELAEAGCVAFGQANRAIVDTQVLLRAMMYAATFDFPVWLQAQDPFLARKGVAHDGEVAARLGLVGIPVAAETIALATILQLARETGARVHVTRISSAAGVEMITAARAAGIAVTCDVGVHHLHLCENDVGFLQCACATRSAAALHRRSRRPAPWRWPPARSTRCVPTTPRSMTTASRCPSTRPRLAPPAWNCCCR
jgi:dihydroorotase